MTSKLSGKLYNLKVFIILLLVCSGTFAVYIASSLIIREYMSYTTELKSEEVSGYAARIAYQIKITDYLSSTNDTIDDELDVASELFGGRIIVVDSAFRIIYDSYGRDLGKTAIMREITAAFNGDDHGSSDINNGIAELTYTIKNDEDGSVSGCMLFIYSLEKEGKLYERLLMFSRSILYISLIVLALLAVVAVIIIIRPLKEAKKVLTEISNGNLDTEIQVRGVYEFKRFFFAINEMLKKVKRTEEIQQEFVSNVSHEMKTPMASMKVLADSLLMQDTADVAVYREFLRDINEEIDRENGIITDLLTLVRMDKKADRLNIALCSMNNIMDVVIKRVTPLAQAREIEVMYESYREISAEVDDKKLIMAITNLSENAVKYNREHGKVRITLNSDTQYVYVTVEDTGVGVPEEAIPHLFDRFYRVDKARDRETGGTGLGLSIANDIVRMHNGVIKVHSQENVGTTFTIRIPISYRKRSKNGIQ